MTTLHIGYKVSDSALSKIAEMIDYERVYNPNWSGANIQIMRDEYTWIDDDSINAIQLFSQVRNLIERES
jgi:hypothetical protein